MNLTRQHSRPSFAHRCALIAAIVTLAIATCASAAALHVDVKAASTQGQPDSLAVKIPAGTMTNLVLSRVNPVYPAAAREAHITGSVLLETLIGIDGTVQHLAVLSGPAELQASAVEAVRQWTYQPYLLNGRPTPVQTTVTVNYQLAR